MEATHDPVPASDAPRMLYLMRHAKAVDHDPRSDHGRALAARGWDQSAAVGQRIAGRPIELVLCSTATRTRQTLEGLGLPALGGSTLVEYQDALYDASTETVRQRIGETDGQVRSVLVVGHAPSIPTLVAELAAQLDRRAADELAWHYPTATLTWFALRGDWADLADPWPDRATITAFGGLDQLGRT